MTQSPIELRDGGIQNHTEVEGSVNASDRLLIALLVASALVAVTCGSDSSADVVMADDVEVHVLETDAGVLSMALVTDGGALHEFRPEALALADTLELYIEPAKDC